jgi:hypothetical protein
MVDQNRRFDITVPHDHLLWGKTFFMIFCASILKEARI